jgi:hypothetical protein
MGVINEIFAAQPSEITPALIDHGPDGHMPSIGGKGMGSIELALLHQALRGRTTPPQFDEDDVGAELLACGGDQGPWMFRLSDDLVTRLSLASKFDLERTHTLLIQNEAFECDSPADHQGLSEWLVEMRRMASNARSGSKNLYLWTSL